MPRAKNLNPVCKECGLRSDDLSKYKKSYNKDKHSGYCNLCLKCSNLLNKESIKASSARIIASKKALVQKAKDCPCADCGQQFHFSAMTFDHLPGYVKLFDVSKYAKKTILQINEEIQKCEVVCANCHAVRSFERLNKASQ